MSEIRQLNDARRKRFCHPGAERDEFVICDLGTPWCRVAHNEVLEMSVLEAARDGVEGTLMNLLFELHRRECVVDSVERQAERWEVLYYDRWGAKGALYLETTPSAPAVLRTHRAQLEKELRKPQEFSGADLMAALSIVGLVMAAMISIVWVASLL